MEKLDLGIEGLTDFVEIGSGGFAVVYAAKDERFGRTVAVKVLANLDADGHRRFEREQLSMGRMTGHPNVVIPFSSGVTSTGRPYLIMEYLTGGSLADIISTDGPLGWVRAAEAILPIADALGHGHSQGVLHRDVKPGNILLRSDGVTKLADFGIASIREGTATEFRPFTLSHSPPETFTDGADRRDERSDLYSLASTLFEAAVGWPPYHTPDSNSYAAYLVRIAKHPVPTIGADPRYDEFLASALAKEPDQRPQTAADFVHALERTIAAPPPSIATATATPSTTPSTTPSATPAGPLGGHVAQRPPRVAAVTGAVESLAPPAAPLAPRPGWYPVDHGLGVDSERYWDGVQWGQATRRTHPGHNALDAPQEPASPLGPPPGWYDDPSGSPGVERRWDGARWTDLSRPADAPSS